MKTIEEIIMLVEDNKDYIAEVKKMDLKKEDAELLNSIFNEFQSVYDKSGMHLLNYVGDTYIREKFTEIVLKLA